MMQRVMFAMGMMMTLACGAHAGADQSVAVGSTESASPTGLLGDLLDGLLDKDEDKDEDAPAPPDATPAEPAAPTSGEDEWERRGDVPYRERDEAQRRMIRFTLPTQQTRWEHGERNLRWKWDEASVQGKVRFELWRGRRKVADLKPTPVDNDGDAVFKDPVPEGWGSGHRFYIVAIDSRGRMGVSPRFTIYGGVLVLEPNETSVWQANQRNQVRVGWDQTTAKGGRVKIELFKGDNPVAVLRDDVPNDGVAKDEAPMPTAWGEGDDFRVRVTDRQGRTGFSEAFTINRGVRVLYPDEHTVVRYPGRDLAIRWDSGSVVGDKVRFELWKGESKVADLTKNVENKGHAVRSGAMEAAWGTGAGYRIKAIDGKGHEGWSKPFAIAAEIEVTHPDRSTVWTAGQGRAAVRWKRESASGPVRFELWTVDKAQKRADFIGESKNNGEAVRGEGLDPAIEPGDYRIKAIDTSGFTGWSEAFRVKAARGNKRD